MAITPGIRWRTDSGAVALAGLVALAMIPGKRAEAQAVWQADIRIAAMDVRAVSDKTLSISVRVTSDNDDDARASRLDLLLPVGVSVVRLGDPCRLSPSPIQNLVGRVSCDLGDIQVGGVREVTLITSVPARGLPARFAAFVVSDTPDPNPSNNHMERGKP